jgi:DNA-binding NarL/FixJ family response regulator
MAKRPVLLLVDDDPAVRELLGALFSMNGRFRIGGVAADGLEGAMLAADVQPDVVILDFYMPRWDGSKAAEFIHKNCPKSKIVAFSAVLTEPPEWGDAFVLKTDIDKLVPTVMELTAAA